MTYDSSRGRTSNEPQENQSDMSSGGENNETSPDQLIANFPEFKLRSLIMKISSARWVVPVLPDQELECLLNAAIDLTIAGVDHECESCVKFYREGLLASFMKILTDDAVNSWKPNIHYCIFLSCGKLMQLCALHMKRDNPYLLDLLAVALDPGNKFNIFNAARHPDMFNPHAASTSAGTWGTLEENEMFAKPLPEPRTPMGWLIDLINRFGFHGGFDGLLERFNIGVAMLKNGSSAEDNTSSASSSMSLSDDLSKLKSGRIAPLNLQLIYALIRPFGQCYELLTTNTIEKYFMPIWQVVLDLLDNLSDDELKREAKPEGRSDSINGIVKATRNLASRLPNQDSVIKDLEMLRLKMILRLLKVSSFNGKMNALNEINKMISSVTYSPARAMQSEDEVDWLTADRMATWIKETDVLGIVLRDSLHQPQYVEKLEKIIRFLIKEKALTLDDLDAIWRAQAGKHETIVKNVHDLLAKLAWDFSAEQLDHLFECFQESMTTANKRQRERLLELIRRLAEDDKNGVMANKVLQLFWSLAHSPGISQEVMDQALAAHVKILDYSCSQERDAQKTVWLDKCVEELKSLDSTWVLPALRLIREICCLYEASSSHPPRAHQNLNRQQVIDRLQNDHSLVILVTNSLTAYLEKIRNLRALDIDFQPNSLKFDGRYTHPQQIQERLDFLKFLLKDGQLWLCADQAKQIWHCLAVNAIFPSDREECFRWFGKLMGEEPDLDPGINKDFFENNLLQLDPTLLTESGIKCFERFFKAVNSKEEKLKAKHRNYVLDDEDLIGKDYLWRVITTAGEEISNKAIELLKEVSTALGPRLQSKVADFHENFINECYERLRTHYDNINILSKTIDGCIAKDEECVDMKARLQFAEQMCRVIRVLQEYIKECDRNFTGDRMRLPLARASRGKHIIVYIRFQNTGRQIDDIEVNTHSNETMASFKRTLLREIGGCSVNSIRIELYHNTGEPIECTDDSNPLSQFTIRDRSMLTAKISPIGPGLSSSPDSSSDSSTGSPPRPYIDTQRQEVEKNLPGVLIAQKKMYIEFFIKLYQLGSDLEHGYLRDSSRTLLHLLPMDIYTMQQLQRMCGLVTMDDNVDCPTPELMFLHLSPAQVLYNLEVLHAMLLPAVDPGGESTMRLQLSWLHSGCAHFVLDLITKNNFLPNTHMHTKRSAFQCVLRLTKFYLYIVGCILSKVGKNPVQSDSFSTRPQVDILKEAFRTFLGNAELTLRLMALRLSEKLAVELLTDDPEGTHCRNLFESALSWSCPDLVTVKAIVQLAWASSCGSLDLLGQTSDFSEETSMPEQQDVNLFKEALDVLTISLILNPKIYGALMRDPIWPKFITSLVLRNQSRSVRQLASDQLFLGCTYSTADNKPSLFIIRLLVDNLQTTVPQNSATCAEFFQFLCRTLNYGCMCNWQLPMSEDLLTQEITWLRSVRDGVRESGETPVHEDLLEGHISLTKELMFYLAPELKSQLSDLILELVDDFLFPASRQYLQLRRTSQLVNKNAPPPVCRSPRTIAAACDLLVALCQKSTQNLKLLVTTLIDMFCSDTEPLREWEYLPPVGPRPSKGFCGLKNAGATCYVNSVLQQLYMVPLIRIGILSATGAANDPNEDFSGETESSPELYADDGNNRRNYHVGILKHVQAIFAHLGHSALQFYVPKGLWTHFKLQGEPVNLREQQDAVEFFMSLFESLDEGLKALGHQQLMGATLGGCFSDQKICQGCPHRYSKEEPFSVFSVDIRNHSSLTESLEQYVKGELLEGADAYHCDKCDKKVVTIKRLCVRKLPPVLAIQLKRFEYDYERVCAIKFNDYFEFPRILDMEPYTVSGLAKIEGEVIEIEDNTEEEPITTKYMLTGIVVHSGQASGGHYFSYILHRDLHTGKKQWYKFDDGEVTECKMHEDEELKAQCFGGDYMGEVYDNNLKRMQYRRQKRWWNAYMLFYTRCDQSIPPVKPSIEQLSLAESRDCVLPMPEPIEKSVRLQNIRFLHSRSLFSSEFFNFIRKLVSCCVPPTRTDKLSPQAVELSQWGVKLASKFMFHSGFRTKKTLRGAAIDWCETLSQHLRPSSVVRRWFAENALLNPPSRLGEYILVAPSPEVRIVFVKLVVLFCHFAIKDDPIPGFEGEFLGEQVLNCALQLLRSEVSDHGKHLPHYFQLFCMYAGLGVKEKHQLLKLNVPAIFMKVALDEGPGPPIKYQYPELSKLHQVVSHLVRCSDISSHCRSSKRNCPPKPNIYVEPNIPPELFMPLSKEATDSLFLRTSYIKKLIEDTNVGDDGLKLLQYCSWENPQFSHNLLLELLWQCGFAYWHDMRQHTDLLLNILLMEDSWQEHRIHNALNGVAEEREGLLDTIQRAKTHYQKRAYQIIKCLVQLFSRSQVAHNMLNSNHHIARHWTKAVEWLQEELERSNGVSNQYPYTSWSPPVAQSNDNTNGYVLERSQSAKNILQMAFELCPEEEQEEANESDGDPDMNEDFPRELGPEDEHANANTDNPIEVIETEINLDILPPAEGTSSPANSQMVQGIAHMPNIGEPDGNASLTTSLSQLRITSNTPSVSSANTKGNEMYSFVHDILPVPVQQMNLTNSETNITKLTQSGQTMTTSEKSDKSGKDQNSDGKSSTDTRE